jgi:signal transduction histidine kinase
VLLLTAEAERASALHEMLAAADREARITTAHTFDKALSEARATRHAAVLAEGAEGLSFLEHATGHGVDLPVVFIAPDDNPELLDKARIAGASDALFQSEITPSLLDQALRHAIEWHAESHPAAQAGAEARKTDLPEIKRTESLARLISGLAHEIRNPLSLIQLAGDFLARPKPLTPENQARLAQYLQDGVQRIEIIVEEMFAAFVPRQLARAPEDPVALIEDAMTAAGAAQWEAAGISVTREIARDLPKVFVDRARMLDAIAHLFANAADAIPGGGVISVHARQHTFEASEREDWQRAAWFWAGDTAVILEIGDSGPGIPPEKLPHVFEPFFTLRPAGRGTGLRLAATKKIVELHSGRVSIVNRPEGGSLARLVLKTAAQPARND